MWGIPRIEGCLYVSVHWGGESKPFISEEFGLDDECRVLHDITVQGGERARGWERDEAMSSEMCCEGKGGRGKILKSEGSGRESHALLLVVF